ncbi:hypothetical protein NUU61_003391 [Penicillium alfredii]|uniref:Uncharacterized protein n=1 Tax=Penicillium alfredii TaxID=1506179 RepID=A0A9W9FTE3_9EURO|nr:uncharacterized protein NUU61_003391 [Penicillium alfredii]KAJ5106044.1 hypothetical protein NUU61_003391 [Penicillium alfredii]
MQYYKVFIVKFTLTTYDPNMPTPRYDTTIFVETHPNGTGYIHHVLGDNVSPTALHYERRMQVLPEESRWFHSRTQLGVTRAATYPAAWDGLLQQISQATQSGSSSRSMFVPSGDSRGTLVKGTEWTFEQAIPALKAAGLLQEVYFR